MSQGGLFQQPNKKFCHGCNGKVWVEIKMSLQYWNNKGIKKKKLVECPQCHGRGWMHRRWKSKPVLV